MVDASPFVLPVPCDTFAYVVAAAAGSAFVRLVLSVMRWSEGRDWAPGRLLRIFSGFYLGPRGSG